MFDDLVVDKEKKTEEKSEEIKEKFERLSEQKTGSGGLSKLTSIYESLCKKWNTKK